MAPKLTFVSEDEFQDLESLLSLSKLDNFTSQPQTKYDRIRSLLQRNNEERYLDESISFLSKSISQNQGMNELGRINSIERSVSIDWFIELCLKLHLKESTLYYASDILDAVILNSRTFTHNPAEFELVAIAAINLAVRFNEVFEFNDDILRRISKGKSNRDQILRKENEIVGLLIHSAFLRPSRFDLLFLLCSKLQLNETQFLRAAFMLEASLLNSVFSANQERLVYSILSIVLELDHKETKILKISPYAPNELKETKELLQIHLEKFLSSRFLATKIKFANMRF